VGLLLWGRLEDLLDPVVGDPIGKRGRVGGGMAWQRLVFAMIMDTKWAIMSFRTQIIRL